MIEEMEFIVTPASNGFIVTYDKTNYIAGPHRRRRRRPMLDSPVLGRPKGNRAATKGRPPWFSPTAKAQAREMILDNSMNCAQIAGVVGVWTNQVVRLALKLQRGQRDRRREATCPVCKEPWKIKGNLDPCSAVAEYIEMNGCSRCLESGESAARGLM